MIGVNFQPGLAHGDQPGASKPQGQGVQEAIKVLSLRLPKVVGAQAGAPQALLQGAGSGGSRVDSVVNQVLSRIMPTGQPQQAPQANLAMPDNAPSFSGAAQPEYQPRQMPQRGAVSVDRVSPRVTMELPDDPWGSIAGLLNQMPSQPASSPSMFGLEGHGQPPASIAPLPNWPATPFPQGPRQREDPFGI